MGMCSDRYLELSAARTQVVCRLHALVCELVPGRLSRHVAHQGGAAVLEGIEPNSPANHARLALAGSRWATWSTSTSSDGRQQTHGPGRGRVGKHR